MSDESTAELPRDGFTESIGRPGAGEAGTAGAPGAIMNAINDALRPLGDHIALAFVFGSMARGEEQAGSDVDLLVLGTLPYASLVKALYPAQETLQREINPVLYTTQEFAQRQVANDPFLRELMSRPKLFVIGTDHDLGELAGDSQAAGV